MLHGDLSVFDVSRNDRIPALIHNISGVEYYICGAPHAHSNCDQNFNTTSGHSIPPFVARTFTFQNYTEDISIVDMSNNWQFETGACHGGPSCFSTRLQHDTILLTNSGS